MAWVSAAASVVGLGMSASAANEAGNAADAAARRQGPLIRAQAAGAELQNEMGRFQFNRYRERFVPLEDRFIEEAGKGIDPALEAGAAVATTRQAFDKQGDITERQMGRRGINTNDGAILDFLKEGGLAEAKAVAGADVGARRYAKERSYAMLADATNVGRGTAAAGSASINSGANINSSAINALGNVMDYQGDLANAASGAAGGFISDLSDWASKNYPVKPAVAGTA